MRVVSPRPDWNSVGPYITERWRRGLKKISSRLALQYFPTGCIPGTGVRGFWAVCMRLPRSGLLYKQNVLMLTDAQGCFRHPDWGTLHELKVSWYRQRHEGMDAIFDSIDREIEFEREAEEDRQRAALLEAVERTITQLDPSSRELGLARVCVPG